MVNEKFSPWLSLLSARLLVAQPQACAAASGSILSSCHSLLVAWFSDGGQ